MMTQKNVLEEGAKNVTNVMNVILMSRVLYRIVPRDLRSKLILVSYSERIPKKKRAGVHT